MGGRNMAIIDAVATDARRGPRFRVLLVARLLTTSGERNVKLRDISANGAMIEGDRLPAPGTDVLLRRGSLELIATIIWTRDGRAGLEFDEPLTRARGCRSTRRTSPRWRPSLRPPRSPGPARRLQPKLQPPIRAIIQPARSSRSSSGVKQVGDGVRAVAR